MAIFAIIFFIGSVFFLRVCFIVYKERLSRMKYPITLINKPVSIDVNLFRANVALNSCDYMPRINFGDNVTINSENNKIVDVGSQIELCQSLSKSHDSDLDSVLTEAESKIYEKMKLKLAVN